ncbi:MAG: molybdopterin-dependent oxidoreductase [Chloroflexi bacterium]|nr:molybdopterin-dependent oxidoreductase [Chloroflexota bacterium]
MQAIWISRKQRFNIGFLAGLAAGIVASALMLLLSVTVGGVSLPEVFGSTFTQLLPPTAFDYLHRTIGGDAKHYLFYGILVGQCLVFALSGGLCNLLIGSAKFGKKSNTQGQLHWLTGVILALLLWLLTGLIFLPLTGAGIFGAELSIGVVSTILSLAAVGLTFGLLFVYAQNWLVLRRLRAVDVELSDRAEAANYARRAILQRGLVVLGLGTLGVVAWRFITGSGGGSSASVSHLVQNFKNKVVPPPVPNYGTIKQVPQLSAEVTSNQQYYVVSKNLFSDPTVDSQKWQLTVNGEVHQPFTLTYNELLAMPMKQQYESMMCISNEVGGEYMSNALWEGIPLADLLARAGGVKPGATKVVLYAVDDYSDSIHLSKALEPTTLVAVHMNGVALPSGHGFPARLLVPGIYGMKHVKWITRIEVVNQDYQGYWQVRGWSDPAPIRLTSRIDTPVTGTTVTVNKPTYIAGVAFSGNKGISEMDVSLDAGKTWQRATLKRPLSALTWVLWELPWQPTKPGTYTIVARAIDMEGIVQDPNVAPPLPDGATGYHTINVTVA